MSLISLQEANYKASKLHSRESSGECLVIKQEKIKPLTLNEIFDTCFDEAYTLPADKKAKNTIELLGAKEMLKSTSINGF